ncbi:cupin domain-containing protein [Spirosoma gilvum]
MEQIAVTQSNSLRAYNGGFLRVLISPEQTGGSFALLDITLPKGSEPPRHTHTREDETFYLLEGSVRFDIGEQSLIGQPGQAIFAPRNIEHQFSILSEHARIVTLLTPGDFANYFVEFSQPIPEVPTVLQAPQGPPPTEMLAHLLARLSGGYGVQFA